MHFVVLPPEALSNADSPPFGIGENSQHTRFLRVKVAFWDAFQKRLGKDDMSGYEYHDSTTYRYSHLSSEYFSE